MVYWLWVMGYLVTWLLGYLVTWLLGYWVTGLGGYLVINKSVFEFFTIIMCRLDYCLIFLRIGFKRNIIHYKINSIMLETKFSFERLEVWQEARKLVVDTYKLVRKFPNEEKFAMGDQIRRAVVSVSSNIAEGSGRGSLKEKIHFIEIAYGSLMEVECQIDVAHDLTYISDDDWRLANEQIRKIGALLAGLRSKRLTTLNPLTH